jgi:hypothetical protein
VPSASIRSSSSTSRSSASSSSGVRPSTDVLTLGVKHALQPPTSYSALAKSRDVLLRDLRRAQVSCTGNASLIKQELLFRKNHEAPLALVTASYRPPPTTDEMIQRAHAFEHLRSTGDWIATAVAALQEPADFAMAERFAEEALTMIARGRP